MFFDKFVVPNPRPHAYLLFSEARRLSISSSYEMIYIWVGRLLTCFRPRYEACRDHLLKFST
jgi:hypothetical protein